MKSNICKIRKGNPDFRSILNETEKVTVYNGLAGKKALSLRLLAEELVSMLPEIAKNFDGEFWVETDGEQYELHIKMSVDDMDMATRENFIKVSSHNKNAAAVGITGKIRAVFDYMVLGGDEANMVSPAGRYEFAASVDFSCCWSLQQYKSNVTEEEPEKWDELEKSIIAKLADDVIVGVKGKNVNIIIRKSF